MSSTMVKREKGTHMRIELQLHPHPPWWLLFLGQFVHWPLSR